MTDELIIEGWDWVPMPMGVLTDHRLSPMARILFGLLVHHGKSQERCFPGHARLAAMAGIAERSVAKPLRELEVAGWITRHRRNRPDGTRTSDGYTLHITKASDEPRVTTPQSSASQARDLARAKRAISRGEHLSRRELEQDERAPADAVPAVSTAGQLALLADGERVSVADAEQDLFDEWYGAYPRKIDPKKARAAFRVAVKNLGGFAKAEPVIVAGANRWNAYWTRGKTETRHIPHPTSWLNGEHYLAVPAESDRRTRR
jgi:hypothetical protein